MHYSTKATVVRDNQKRLISSVEIVPGDLILLGAGNKVPADVRLLEVFDFQVAEAGLTEESSAEQL
ncbi:hypothetical protein LC608_34495 [Nostoc sp. XA010]|uniref:P-type ATPase n=1 Tax=Nostoc sp. XA010 TaxID=2780407 RepID=UPI0027E040EE|nr:hypothetical protein [Nostoc sp. XA010]MCC5661959.1 hypothetical protein [Nostoc sp. XA010]